MSLEGLIFWADETAPPPPTESEFVECEEEEEGLGGLGRAVVVACLPIVIGVGSFAVSATLTSLVEKVKDFFTVPEEEEEDSSDDFGDALNELFSKGQDKVATTVAAVPEVPEVSTPGDTWFSGSILDRLFKCLGTWAKVDMSCQPTHIPNYFITLENIHSPAELAEYLEWLEWMHKPLFRLFKLFNSDWPQQKFTMYCDRIRQRFSEDPNFSGGQGSSEPAAEEEDMVASNEFHDALMTLPAGGDPLGPPPSLPATHVLELINFFERSCDVAPAPTDRPQALAEVNSSSSHVPVAPDQVPSEPEPLPEVLPKSSEEEEEPKKIPAEIVASDPESSDLSTDDADFEEQGFCVISNKYTKLQ